MTTSRFGAVVDALVTLVTATDSTTFDGPPLTADVPRDYVIVGGTEDVEDEAGEFVQSWVGLGNKGRDEQGEVMCAVLAGTGDGSVKIARDRALAVLAQIETAVRANPTLSGAVTSGWCQVTIGRPRQVRNTGGTYVRVAFTVAYQSRI